MGIKYTSDEVLLERYKAYMEHGTFRKAADALGLTERTMQRSAKEAAKRGLLGTKPVLPGYKVAQITSQLDANGNVFRESIKQKPEHGEVHEVPDGHLIKRISALTNADGEVINKWIISEPEKNQFLQACVDTFTDIEPIDILPHVPLSTDDDDLLSVYPVADVHFGLKVFGKDGTGDDFDMDIAEQRFKAHYLKLLHKTPQSGTALIPILGDFFHADDDKNMTPQSGNILEVDGPPVEVMPRGLDLILWLIQCVVSKHERVVIKVMRGNHDKNSWIAIWLALTMAYKDADRITVDQDPADYWFFRWGVNLLGFHHGHRIKPEEMAGAMVSECSSDYGECSFHHFYHGHLHHFRSIEHLRVIVECMRTLASKDTFHAGKYQSGRGLISDTWDRNTGLEDRSFVLMKPQIKFATTI